MFTAYHAMMFAILLMGGFGTIFKVSSEEESLATNPIPVKAAEIKIRLRDLPA